MTDTSPGSGKPQEFPVLSDVDKGDLQLTMEDLLRRNREVGMSVLRRVMTDSETHKILKESTIFGVKLSELDSADDLRAALAVVVRENQHLQERLGFFHSRFRPEGYKHP